MSIMKTSATVVVLGVLTTSHLHAAQFIRRYTGQECQALTPNDTTLLSRSTDGCFNSSTALPYPTCGYFTDVSLPISIGNNSDTVDFDDIKVYVYDNTFRDEFVCHAVATDSSLTSYFTNPLTSGVVPQGSITLSWSGAGTPDSGGDIANVRSAHIECSMPMRYTYDGATSCTDEGFSYILAYRVITQE